MRGSRLNVALLSRLRAHCSTSLIPRIRIWSTSQTISYTDLWSTSLGVAKARTEQLDPRDLTYSDFRKATVNLQYTVHVVELAIKNLISYLQIHADKERYLFLHAYIH